MKYRIFISVFIICLSGLNLYSQDYLALAKEAFLEGNYIKCYNLFESGGLKKMKKFGKGINTTIIPYIESCVFLGKWDKAMHGITDDNRITNRRTWVNGICYKLDPVDLEIWNPQKEPLLDHILEEFFYFYKDDTVAMNNSPILNHVCKIKKLPLDVFHKKAAALFWNEAIGISRLNRRVYAEWEFLYCESEFLNCKYAAVRGHIDATKQMAKYYLEGLIAGKDTVVLCDTVQALFWLEKAAAMGDIKAGNQAARIFLENEEDYNKAFALYKKNAELGDIDAKYCLGICYYNGYGCTQDYSAALPLLMETEDFYIMAPFFIGCIYYYQRNPKAITYFEKTLSRKGLDDQIRDKTFGFMSTCYRFGWCGLQVNLEKAKQLLNETKTLKEEIQQSNRNIEKMLVFERL